MELNILELDAGSRSIGKIAEQRGHNVFSVDISPFDKIDLVKDIEHLNINDIPFIPDMIWASPPCTTYSIAAISTHREPITKKPRTKEAIIADRLVKKHLEILTWFPNAIYYIENPRGMLRKMDFMRDLDRTTVCYCKYGDTRMKPTDIFTNNLKSLFNSNGWNPLPMCWNNNKKCHHESAPRGSHTGTQGLTDNYERSKIPESLCKEIIIATENNIINTLNK